MGQSGPEENCVSCGGQGAPVTLLAIAALPPEVPGAMAGGLTAHRFTCPWRQPCCRAWREGCDIGGRGNQRHTVLLACSRAPCPPMTARPCHLLSQGQPPRAVPLVPHNLLMQLL